MKLFFSLFSLVSSVALATSVGAQCPSIVTFNPSPGHVPEIRYTYAFGSDGAGLVCPISQSVTLCSSDAARETGSGIEISFEQDNNSDLLQMVRTLSDDCSLIEDLGGKRKFLIAGSGYEIKGALIKLPPPPVYTPPPRPVLPQPSPPAGVQPDDVTLPPPGSLIEKFINGFREDFRNTHYILGARGPQYYDCSTSIAYEFIKMGLLRDPNGQSIRTSDFRNGAYEPSIMDHDGINFRTLRSTETLALGDLILMGMSCGNPTHWVVVTGIDKERKGERQDNWRINRLMEVKGGARNFDEGWAQRKFLDNNLCAAVRYKYFER